MTRRHGRAVMPFGKYKGVRIRLLPDDYLSWLTTLDWLAKKFKWLHQSLIAELDFRGLKAELASTADPPIADEEPQNLMERKVRRRGEF